MTPAPSSPVPAVERIELPGGDFLQFGNAWAPKSWTLHRKDGHPAFSGPFSDCLKFAKVCFTPTPGRAAEPDTMGEVEQDDRFAREFREAVRVAGAHGNMEPYARVLSGRLRQMDKRAKAANKAIDHVRAQAKLDVGLAKANAGAARTRAETAEAQLSDAQERISDLEYALKNIVQHHPTTPGLLWDYDLQLAESAADIAKRTLLSNPKADR